ncbi:hypothetical protein [Halomarina litorea]|uniref:hypothetical protein n=1 Tax=Halomarina litorea TaxID=2961595 RepID=UPI0020C4556D|nr:hypothetical protein [Halomarina sp. BCD28]
MDTDRTSAGAVTAHERQSGGPPSQRGASDADLHTEVAAHHHPVDASAWEDIYVVGDVHGCYDRPRALLDELDPSDVMLADDCKRWTLHPDATYEQCRPAERAARNTHGELMRRARERAPDRPFESDPLDYEGSVADEADER